MDSGGVVRGSRRLGIMYFIMISQQNCNLQRAMSHTTPTASSSSTSSTSSLVARSFSPLSTLSSLAPRPDSPSRVLSISLALIISTVLSIRLSLLALRPRIVHPALTESHGRRTPANLRLPPIQKNSNSFLLLLCLRSSLSLHRRSQSYSL